MSLQEIKLSEGVRFVKAKECEKGDLMVDGTFVESYRSEKFDQNNYKFTTGDGETVILNGAAQLDKYMVRADVGDRVVIYYDGFEIMQKGPGKGNTKHLFRVSIDKDVKKAAEAAGEELPF